MDITAQGSRIFGLLQDIQDEDDRRPQGALDSEDVQKHHRAV